MESTPCMLGDMKRPPHTCRFWVTCICGYTTQTASIGQARLSYMHGRCGLWQVRLVAYLKQGRMCGGWDLRLSCHVAAAWSTCCLCKNPPVTSPVLLWHHQMPANKPKSQHAWNWTCIKQDAGHHAQANPALLATHGPHCSSACLQEQTNWYRQHRDDPMAGERMLSQSVH